MLLQPDQEWHLHHGDCIEHLATMPEKCVDLSVFSPPFPALYSYTSEACDLGNSEDLQTEAKLHFGFFFAGMARVMKPGRVMVVHATQIPRMKRTGEVGTHDFRGLLIRIAERAGFVYEYDWAVRVNPQSQAIRTKSRALQFAGLEADRAATRGAMPAYLIKFRAPGENEVPINGKGEVSRNEWIEWAECTWGDIRETDTLNVTGTKGEGDTRHICPLQLPIIDRLVRLFSNKGEIVFTPFAGIGSELYQSLKRNRRAYGCELKGEYHATAMKNIDKAIREREASSRSLFDAIEEVAV